MAYAGNLRESVAYVTALQQGSGWNPVHAIRTMGPPLRTGGQIQGFSDTVTHPADDYMTEEGVSAEHYGFTDEDSPAILWGYGHETGTADRDGWAPNSDDRDTRATTKDYPQWGRYEAGIPGGTAIRTVMKGAILSNRAKVDPDEDVLQGFENKVHSYVEDSQTSDPSQYERQTSFQQRDAVRAGSQSSGTASEYNAPIKQVITAMKLRIWSSPTSPRHQEMHPYQQEQVARPFRVRTAGLGPSDWHQTNELYVSEPLQRTSPDNPYQGPTVAQPTDNTNNGYTNEDLGWY